MYMPVADVVFDKRWNRTEDKFISAQFHVSMTSNWLSGFRKSDSRVIIYLYLYFPQNKQNIPQLQTSLLVAKLKSVLLCIRYFEDAFFSSHL